MSYLSRRMREERRPWARQEVDAELRAGADEFGIKLAELAKMADLQLMPWQQHMMRELYIDQHSVPRLVDPPARRSQPAPFIGGRKADMVIVDEIVDELFASSSPCSPAEVNLADVVRAAHELMDAPKLPERIKLTSGEWETAKACVPVPSDWGPNRPADWIWGVPVELVDDPEESDLFEVRARQNGKRSDLEARSWAKPFARERLSVWPTSREDR